MWWPESSGGGTAGLETALMEYAAGMDIDCAHAQDVVGAVFSFCRARHGAIALDDVYLRFLVARALTGPLAGRNCSVTAPPGFPAMRHGGGEPAWLLRALHASRDPSSLYEAYRRRLVGVRCSDVDACGKILRIDLRVIQVGPNEDLPLACLPVLRKLSGWAADWRRGNPALATIRIAVRSGGVRLPVDQLVDALRDEEKRVSLPPAAILR